VVGARRRGSDLQLALDPRRVAEVRRAQRARPGELAREQCDALALVERFVPRLDAGALQ